MEQLNYMVCVSCMTYNHAPYITDALNGFCMQETTFPFVCTIVDDASTDGEQEVIKKYLQEHFDLEDKAIVRHEETDDYILTFVRHKTNKNCFFAVLYLKYNHYSIKKFKMPYVAEWHENCKYIAICEGDDYWIEADKLQKQVDYLKENKKCMMVCNATRWFSVKKGKFLENYHCYNQNQYISTEDIILKGGGFIPTCSIMYKKSVKESYPLYCKQCHVGDYPLQIMCAMKGDVYYFDKIMNVYRVENSNSWVGRHNHLLLSESLLKGFLSEVQMLKGFMHDYPQYVVYFKKRIIDYIIWNVPDKIKDHQGYMKFIIAFKDDIQQFQPKDTFLLKWKSSRFSKSYYSYIQYKNTLKNILKRWK